MDNWYLVYCRPKQELRAQQHLANIGFDSYVPTLWVKKQRGQKMVETKELLFPRYLFLSVAGQCDLSIVKNTRGVTDFVRFGGKIAKVPADLIKQLTIQQLQVQKGHNAQYHFAAGDVLHINDGPYTGLPALFDMPDGDERSIVFVTMLNQPVKLNIGNVALTKAFN
jgi:transcriptional antiterminator RfaH